MARFSPPTKAQQMKKKKKKVADQWSNLNPDLLQLILNRLNFFDKVRFRVVCSSWRSIAKTQNRSPWLMLPGDSDCGNYFFNPTEKKLYKPKSKAIEDSRRSRSRCVGSSRGWLVYLELEENIGKRTSTHTQTLLLFNPFSDVVVRPCSLPALPFIIKAVLCSDPIRNPNNCGIVAIYGGFRSELAYARCGDSKWTHLAGSHKGYCDVICVGNYVYAWGDSGFVDAWELSSSSVPEKKIRILEGSFPREELEFEKSLGKDLYSTQFYLVGSSTGDGELFLVVRYIANFFSHHDGRAVREDDLVDSFGFVYPYMTRFFRVYKAKAKAADLDLDLDLEEDDKWEKVEGLGDQVLFLGGNESISVSAREFPEYERNSIYFTDDYWDRMDEHYDYGGHDMGVFNLEDGGIKDIDGVDFDFERIQPPPFWV